jgi:hypothetical protein
VLYIYTYIYFLFNKLVITEKLKSSKQSNISTKHIKPSETKTNHANDEYLLSIQVSYIITNNVIHIIFNI